MAKRASGAPERGRALVVRSRSHVQPSRDDCLHAKAVVRPCLDRRLLTARCGAVGITPAMLVALSRTEQVLARRPRRRAPVA